MSANQGRFRITTMARVLGVSPSGYYAWRQRPPSLSMGSVGDCFDNAMVEIFFATLECELLDRTTLSTHAEARAVLFQSGVRVRARVAATDSRRVARLAR